MLESIRNAMKSKIGMGIALVVLVLIAFAFTSGDVATNQSFGGIAGGDRVAEVGDERIDTSTLSNAITSALERIKQDDPNVSMKSFLANDGGEDVLEDLIDRLAIAVFGRSNGIVASNKLIDSEIANIPGFKGADGKFSEEQFRSAINQRGISEQTMRDDIAQGLIARQVMIPASFGAAVPNEFATRYAALLKERRRGEIAVLPSIAFAPEKEPTKQEIAAYYNSNREDFIRPERRIIRYASFGDEFLKDVPPPSDEEIAFRYNANRQNYQASEKRRITQLILPTEAAAKAVADEVASGKSLEAAATAKGLAANKLELFSRSELTRQFSKGVADAAFTAARGKIGKPVRSPLGWHIARVEEIDSQPARGLTDVRDELAKEIAIDKQRTALAEKLDAIVEGFDAGSNLREAAEELGVEVKQSRPLTADGLVYLTAGEKPPEILTRVIDTAFVMDTEEPQLAEVEAGKRFVLFDVTDIAESAPAPLKEIEDNVKSALILEKASQAARAAAEKVQAQMRDGSSLTKALASLKKRLPPVQPITMTRPELAQFQQSGQQVPPPIGLMFNMAEGTVKVQPAPQNRAWFVVYLKDIEPGKIGENDPAVAGAKRNLQQVLGSEYADALGRAIRSEIGVSRNDDGIRAVREQLGGGN